MNPIVSGWYADPEARFYEGRFWIYVTQSFSVYEDQMNLTAFSSADLVHWEKHENIIDMSGYPYIHRAVWAPTCSRMTTARFTSITAAGSTATPPS